MTLNETRQLGIEFERRIQTILPATETVAKLDSDTIYSFLNQYQYKYVHDIYRSLDKIEPGTKLSAHVERILQAMLKTMSLTEASSSNYDINYGQSGISDVGRSKTYYCPTDFQMYIRSVSKVNTTIAWKGDTVNNMVLPNVLTNQSDVWRLVETPHDSLRILRYPAAILTPYTNQARPTLTVIHDRYTKITGVKMTYYKEPSEFNVMDSTACELPYDCFDDIVTGAVELYMNYVRGGIRQQEEDGRRERAAQR